MGAFAIDQSLGPADLELLQRSVAGDLSALETVCRRFEIPILAVALRKTRDLRKATSLIEPTLTAVCAGLLAGDFPLDQWARQALGHLEALAGEQTNQDGESEEAAAGLTGMAQVPRVVRARAVRRTLPTLPAPELTAVLMDSYLSASAEAMAGLVAESPQAAQSTLEQALSRLDAVLEAAAKTSSERE
jgi:DNA-directed RNA polymerase specialized sigma24 family protein